MKDFLPIIITGKGAIPRVGGIGPRLTPFTVNFNTLEVIVKAPNYPGASFVDPVDGSATPLTTMNYKEIFRGFNSRPKDEVPPNDISDDDKKDDIPQTPVIQSDLDPAPPEVTPPPIPQSPVDNPPPVNNSIPPVVEEKKESSEPEKKEEKKEERKNDRSFSMPRFTKPSEDKKPETGNPPVSDEKKTPDEPFHPANLD